MGGGGSGGGSGLGGGQDGCEQRSEAFVKIRKNIYTYFFYFFLFFFFGGGGVGSWGSDQGGGVRVDVNGEVKFL